MTLQNERLFEAPIAHELASERSYEMGGGPVALEYTGHETVLPGAMPGYAEAGPSWESALGGVSPEAWPELSPEAWPETSPETTPELSPEAWPEAWPELSPEAWPELSPEMTLEAWPEISPETTPGLTPEAWPELSLEMSPEAWPETSPDGAPGEAERQWLRQAARAARRAAPGVIAAAGRLAPGIGAALGVPPSVLMGGMLQQLLREAEAEVEGVEQRILAEISPEAGPAQALTERALDAALAERLAAQATVAATEAEAEAYAAAQFPVTVRIAGGGATVRPAMPGLLQGRRVLVRQMYRHGPAARRLLATLPSIDTLAVRILVRMLRGGRPATTRTALAALAAASRAVLADPRAVRRALDRNAVLRGRPLATSPPPSARPTVGYPSY